MPTLRDRALGIMATATLLAVLYFARDVLVPITLAFILSLLIAPLVRALRHVGLGQTVSVLAAVIVLALSFGAIGGVIGSQLVGMAGSLPQYERTLEVKLETLDRLTVRRVNAFTAQAGRVLNNRNPEPPQPAMLQPDIDRTTPIPVELHEAPANSWQVLQRVLGSIWVPFEMAGIVLVVLVFVLLEQEALRDRFIRIAGGTDIRLTTLVLNDAGERLSRFFVSQLSVNVGVGVAVWLGLMLIGLPHGVLWAVLTTLLRFVPYVGVFVAAGSAALLAAAVDPGWTLVFELLGLFAAVELIASQVVEPQLYGHSTGLSPLSVVVAAIFWSWIWGPIGLLLSTPLTLCLVVAGRHIHGLSFLDVLLGDTPALSMSERFYQRAMSGDHEEIVAAAHTYLKRKSFARYCDKILMPALQLASADLGKHSITPQQQAMVKSTIAHVIEALGTDGCRPSWRTRRGSVLDETSIGVHLRHQRERATGQWQGPLVVPPGSVALCIGLGSMRDDLVTELLVRILRTQDIDARHLSLEDLAKGPPPGSSADSIAMLFVVSAYPDEEWQRAAGVLPDLRERFVNAVFVGLLPEGEFAAADEAMDLVVHSFEEAAAEAAARYSKTPAN